jgi:hypothetical protein
MGDDPGQETVTLINTGATAVSLEGWQLLDAMHNRYAIPSLPAPLPAGGITTIPLPRHSIQLSNRGGEIRLLSRDGSVAHLVSYSRDQAAEQGITLTF